MTCHRKIDVGEAECIGALSFAQTVGNAIAGAMTSGGGSSGGGGQQAPNDKGEMPSSMGPRYLVQPDDEADIGPIALTKGGRPAYVPDTSTTVDEVVVTAQRRSFFGDLFDGKWNMLGYDLKQDWRSFTASSGGAGGTYSNYFYYQPQPASEISQLRQEQAQFQAGMVNRDPIDHYIARPVGQYMQAHPRAAALAGTVGSVVEMGGGAASFVGGAATSEFGVGIPAMVGGGLLAAHGLDDFQANLRALLNGQPTPTYTNLGLQKLGLSPEGAGMVEFIGTAAAGGFAGSGYLTRPGAPVRINPLNFTAPEGGGEFQLFYRGDATPRTTFLSDVADTRGISASNELIANAERRGSVSQLFEDHALTSTGSPFISLSSSEEVAQHFARGLYGDQAGTVTAFRLPKNYAQPNFENPSTWEREYLAPTQIDQRYIVHQYQVMPK